MKKGTLLLLTCLLVFSITACNPTAVVTEEPTAPVVERESTAVEETAEPTAETEMETKTESVEAADEKILVYISGPEGMVNKLEQAFEEQHGDVLEISIMGCGQLRTKVWTESQAGQIEADVFWGSNPLLYKKLDAVGFLEPLELKESDMIAEEFQVTDGNYALVSERYITILYNTNLMEGVELPNSWADLMDPAYDNMFAKADATQSSTAFAIATAFYEMFDGDSFFQGLKDNNIVLAKSNGAIASGVMEGQFSLGIAPYDPVVRLNNKGEKEGFEVPLAAIWPEEGAIAMQRPIAIPVDDSRTPEQDAVAKAFVNFLVSKKAQTIMGSNGFSSVRTDMPNEHLPADAAVFTVNWDLGNENEEAVTNDYTAIFH